MRHWAGFLFIMGLAVTACGQISIPAPAGNPTPAGVVVPARDANEAVPIAPGLRLVGPNHAVELLGVKFVGVNAENGQKLLLTLAYIAVVLLLGRGARAGVNRLLHDHRDERMAFWSRQGIRLGAAVLLILGLVSIWFDDPTRLATALGLVTAGLAFALQRVVTAIAGYFVILRGKTFNVGDRITMGGVRGDVIALGFIQTTIMEMGQPPAIESNAEPAMWVRSRQYTGRVVTVSNDKIFDEPVYNYTRDFPYIWEEMRLPISFTADRDRAERILLNAAERHSVPAGEMGVEALEEMRRVSPLMAMMQADSLEVMSETNAWTYWSRSDAHAMSCNFGADRRAREGLAAAIAALVGHLFRVRVEVAPLADVRKPDLRWFVGLDAQATGIGNALWRGEAPPDRARLVGIFRLAFEDPSDVLAVAAGHPVYLLMALPPDNLLRLKPQNLVAGLPLAASVMSS